MVVNLTPISGDFSEQSNGNFLGQTRSLEERIRNLEFQNRQQESRFYASREGDTEGGSSRGGSRRSSRRRTRSLNDA